MMKRSQSIRWIGHGCLRSVKGGKYVNVVRAGGALGGVVGVLRRWAVKAPFSAALMRHLDAPLDELLLPVLSQVICLDTPPPSPPGHNSNLCITYLDLA